MKENNAQHRTELGQAGEEIARRFLRRIGYKIIGMNVHVGSHGEVDIIAYDPADKVIVFAEVKTREKQSLDYHPGLNVTRLKRAAMTRAARMWVRQNNWEGGYRMDAVFVASGRVTQHILELRWE